MKFPLVCVAAALCCCLAAALPYRGDSSELSEDTIRQLRDFLESRQLKTQQLPANEENEWQPGDGAKPAPSDADTDLESESERSYIDQAQDTYGLEPIQERGYDKPEDILGADVYQQREEQEQPVDPQYGVPEPEQPVVAEPMEEGSPDNINDDDSVDIDDRALPKDISSLFTQKVTKVERYQYADQRWNQAGIVVTLEEGNRLLVLCRKVPKVTKYNINGNSYNSFFKWSPVEEPRPYMILDARIMTEAWKLTETKTIESKATLRTFTNVCGKSASPFDSADMMLALA